MARWQPARADVIAEYAREILTVHPRGRLVVGIDGIEWPGPAPVPSAREAFAGDLAAAIRAEGVPAGAEAIEDSTDAGPFRTEVLAPYRQGRRVFAESTADGWTTDPEQSRERQVLVVSGAFLHVGDWAGMWHTSAWIQLPRAVAKARDAERLGASEAALDDWSARVDSVFRRLDARKLANATFDLTDPEHPRREFEDAC